VSTSFKLPIGEIVVDAPIVSPEYKERPEENARAKIRLEGRILHRMDDLGYLDERGRLWFCGRKNERLETSKGMIPTVPVEAVFDEHPRVARTALVGLGRRGTEVPVLCVEMQPGERLSPVVEEELRARAKGTRWDGLPRRFLAHRRFPVDPRHNSKIHRAELQRWAARRAPDLARGGGE